MRVATFVGLRWLAIAGQSAAVLVTRFGLGFDLQSGWCLLVIGLAALLNIWLRLSHPQTHRLDDTPAALLLGFDVLQLSALLFLTGGLNNPFSMLFLAPLMISAATLSTKPTLLLGLLTGFAATMLMFFHLPLPWTPGQHLVQPPILTLATWVAIVLGAAFTGIYASRVAEEARQLANALAATELVLAREQHLTQLDGLAAAAAHELGTPLATITLVVKELLNNPHTVAAEGVREEVMLLDQEVTRCRTILRRLASLNDESESPLQQMTLSHLIEEVVGPQRHFGVSLTANRRGEGDEPVTARNAGIIYGLGNLVENAIDYARNSVHIESSWTREDVTVRIIDDGPGFPPDILSRFGEPYVQSRSTTRKFKADEGAGLGLGLFIAKTLLERAGAKVSTSNRTPPDTGAAVTVRWPLTEFNRQSAVQQYQGPGQTRRQALQQLHGL